MSRGSPDEVVIRTPDQRLRVFVSSTLGELAEERRAVSRAISALRLTPVMFELGARPYPPQEVYQQYLTQSDVFIGLYWQRYGQLVPGARVSGLEEEFALSGALPRLLYVKTPAPGRNEWIERLHAEAGNLDATVRWYLAHDRGPLPHLFRVPYLFWSQRDLGREAWSWVEQLLPAFGTLDPQARAEVAVVAAALAGEIGDDAAVLAPRQRLAPLLPGIRDPFLHAVAQLAVAWTLPVAGDYGGVLRDAAASLEEFRGQDEPVFTAMAAFTAGSADMALGCYDDALRYLREAHDLAERVGGDWFAAGSRVQLGILDVVRGSLDGARPLLDEAHDLSLAARSTSFVTLCLAGYGWLAFAGGDPERAALLEGAAEGLRRRVGLRAWPVLRRAEAELVARVRQRLGATRFDQVFSAGSGLAQHQAVAIVRDQRGTGTQTP